jgi:hypothetical protein
VHGEFLTIRVHCAIPIVSARGPYWPTGYSEPWFWGSGGRGDTNGPTSLALRTLARPCHPQIDGTT